MITCHTQREPANRRQSLFSASGTCSSSASFAACRLRISWRKANGSRIDRLGTRLWKAASFIRPRKHVTPDRSMAEHLGVARPLGTCFILLAIPFPTTHSDLTLQSGLFTISRPSTGFHGRFSGGCQPAETHSLRTSTAIRLLSCKLITVARPQGVRPRMRVPSSLQLKWSDQR